MTRRIGRPEPSLSALALFDGLNRRERATLARLVDEIAAAPGQPVGGYPGREVAIVQDGTAVESGRVSTVLGPGAIVGPNGATALSRVRLLVIESRALRAVLELAPQLGRALVERRDQDSRTHTGGDWTLRAARPSDGSAIVRLVYGDPLGDGVKLLGTTEQAIRFGSFVASAWPGASWAAATVVEARGNVVAVLQDGPGDEGFQPDLAFVRRLVHEFGPLATVRALPAGAALQRSRVSPPHDSWAIRELHVDPRWRRNGIGSELLRHGESRAKGHGFATVALSTRTNNPARHLYERVGYRAVERRGSSRYSRATGATGRLLMTKALDTAINHSPGPVVVDARGGGVVGDRDASP